MGEVPQPAIHLISPDVKHRDKVRAVRPSPREDKGGIRGGRVQPPQESKNIIESVKHDVLNGMMQIVEVKPKGRMLFDKIYNFIIYWFTILYSVYKRIVLQFSTILVSLFYFCNKETEIKLIFHQIYDDFAKTFPIMGYDIRGKCKIRN